MQESNEPRYYRDPDLFDIRGSLHNLVQAAVHYKWLVVTSCIAMLVIATVYAFTFPPVFVASARVMVEKNIDDSRDAFYNQWNVFRKDDPRTEMELMTSPAMLAQVIKKENLKYDDVYHPLSSELSYLWKKSLAGRTYHRIKDSLMPKKPDPDAPTPEQIELGQTVIDMESGVHIMPVADSNIGELTVKGPSRKVAHMANTLLDIYMEQRTKRYRDEAQRNLDALDKEVDLASREAEEVAARRVTFLHAHGLSFDLGKESQQLTKLVDLEDSIAANRAKAASLQGSLDLIESQLKSEPENRTSATTSELNPIRDAARTKKLDLESNLIAMRQLYRPDSPEVREVERHISDLDSLIASQPERVDKASTLATNPIRQDLMLSRNSLRSQLQGTQQGISVMEQTDRRLRARMAAVPEIQDQLRDLDRQYALVFERYQALSSKRAQAAVSRAMASTANPSMQIVQRATNPDDAAWPKLKFLYPSALLLGLILGVIGAEIRSMTSGRVRQSDLERVLPNSPIYGTIRIPIHPRPMAAAGARPSRQNSMES